MQERRLSRIAKGSPVAARERGSTPGSPSRLSDGRDQWRTMMRFATVLVLTGLIGAAASVYTPTAQAGVYVGVRVPVPVIAAPVVLPPVVSVPVPRVYYPPPPVPYVAI